MEPVKDPYVTAKDAFIAIHQALAHAVECELENGNYSEAISLAFDMEQVEQDILRLTTAVVIPSPVDSLRSSVSQIPDKIDFWGTAL